MAEVVEWRIAKFKIKGWNLGNQHKANEIILKYKLEAYQKNFFDFICGNPTSIEVSGQDKETEARPNGKT
jgi:hypothetical protein